VIAVIAGLWVIRAAAGLLIPVVLAICVSYALEPVVGRLTRYMPRLLATTLVMAAILALFGWGAYALRTEATTAISGIRDALERMQAMVSTYLGAGRRGAGGVADPATLVQQGIGPLMTITGDVVTVLFLVFFLLASGNHFRTRLLEIVHSPEDRRTTAKIIADIDAQVQRFLLVRAATGTGVALATWAVLAWMETPQAGVWAILAGAFNSIPYFGPVIVSGGLLLVGLVQSGDFVRGLQMAAAALAITSIEGWLVTPPLLGRTEQMNAVVVFLGLLFWTWMWGAWGTLLAVPMLVVMKAIADRVDRLRPVSQFMAP
jgi:predicted PurR-regulated permease PerM